MSKPIPYQIIDDSAMARFASILYHVTRLQYILRSAGHIVKNCEGGEPSPRALSAVIAYAWQAVFHITALYKSVHQDRAAVLQKYEDITARIKQQVVGMDWGTPRPDPVAIVVVDARDFRRAVESTSEFPSDGRRLVMVREIHDVRGNYFSEVIPMKPHYTRLTAYQERRFDELVAAAELRIRPGQTFPPATITTQ